MDLSNKTAIVTGASKGIGLETVKLLLKAGAKVAGWSRTRPELENENFAYFETDISDYGSVENAFKLTRRQWGDEIAVLVNNAGLGYQGKFEEISLEEWHRMFSVNVNGIFYATRLVLPLMKQQGEGHIFNISSIAGTTGVEGMAGYSGSKHAVRGISHSLYKEVRNDGIKVTCIYPGSVKTNFFDKIDSVQANENMMRPEDVADTILHAIQTHRNFHLVDIEMRPLKPKG
jgi:NADP-dependent 3-hydroxy acid dehydrogenase YdfG